MAAEKVLGIVDLPTLSEPSLAQQLIEIDYQAYSLEQLERLSEQEKQRTVLIVQDPLRLIMTLRLSLILFHYSRN